MGFVQDIFYQRMLQMGMQEPLENIVQYNLPLIYIDIIILFRFCFLNEIILRKGYDKNFLPKVKCCELTDFPNIRGLAEK